MSHVLFMGALDDIAPMLRSTLVDLHSRKIMVCIPEVFTSPTQGKNGKYGGTTDKRGYIVIFIGLI